MSVIWIARVWPLEIPATSKLVLLSLADQANDSGTCWPSQPQIAKRCSLTDRAVRIQIQFLEEAGMLTRAVKPGVGTTFVLTWLEAEPRNDVPPRNNIPLRNDVPATPEQSSGNPGTTFRQTVSKRQQPSEAAGKPAPGDAGRKQQSKGSRLPADWILPKPWGEWAVAEVPSWTPDQVRKVADKFRDYWIAKPGREAIKADWLATWRNWVRREAERISTPPARSLPTGAPDPFRGAL